MPNLVEIIIRGDATGALAAFSDVKKEAGGLGKAIGPGGLSDVLGTLGKVAIAGAAAGVAALGVGLVASVKAAMDAEKQQAQLQAVLKSTGGAAGVTAEMANGLADSLSKVAPVEDDAILGGENMLLTFTRIGKDVFPQATETMLDMSTALGQDVTSSAMQLGKALNDPIEGVSALQRVGVRFTDAQKDVIKKLVETGDVAGAQKMILGELQTEFGGAAKAAGQTFGGQLTILQNSVGNMMETIGGAFLPMLTDLAKMLTTALNSPEVQAGIKNFSEWLPGALKALVDIITSTVIPILRDLWNQFSTFVTAIAPEVHYILVLVASWLKDHAYEWQVIWEAIQTVLQIAWRTIESIIRVALDILSGDFDNIAFNLEQIWAGLWDSLGLNLKLFIIDMQLKWGLFWNAVYWKLREFAVNIQYQWDLFWNNFGWSLRIALDAAYWNVVTWAANIAVKFWELIVLIQDVLGMHSKSTVFENFGKNMRLGLEAGWGGPLNLSTVTNGMMGGGGAGMVAVSVNLTYAPALSLGNRMEAESALVPFIEQGLRQSPTIRALQGR